MEAKEKAWELYHKYRTLEGKFGDKVLYNYDAKQCALIAVDEILDLNLGLSNCDENNWETEKFYIEVKQEIEKL